jgi:hypothetical protein
MIENAKRSVRLKVCQTCYQRPLNSGLFGPEVPRLCETQCTIFTNLETLLAAGYVTRLSIDDHLQESTCQTCHSCTSAGDFCADRLTRFCPLSRYGAQVMAIVQTLRENAEKTKSIRETA